MDASDTNEMFMECERFYNYIKHVKHSIKIFLKSPNPNKDDVDLYLRTNDELIKLTAWRLKQLTDALDHLGWWRKKMALSYIKMIRNEFLLSQEYFKHLQKISADLS